MRRKNILTVAACALFAYAQEPPKAKFLLSELEQSKLSEFQSRAAAIQAQYELLELRLQTEMAAYAATTLEAHGHPAGVTFDNKTITWKTVQ